MIIFLIGLLACGEELLSYKCTCTQVAFNNGLEAEIDESFSVDICETEENMDAAYEENGRITTEVKACEERLKVDYDESDCECDCEYQGEC